MVNVVAALIAKGDAFLICQRPAHKARGLLWEFVGGKVECGESHAQALARECREELNIEIDVGSLFCEVEHAYPDVSIRLSLYRAQWVRGEMALLEHCAVRFLTVTEMRSYPFCPADEEILCQLERVYGVYE